MWNVELKNRNREMHPPFFLKRGFLIGLGVTAIVAAVLVLGFSLFETFLGGGKFRMVELPGFHELKLDTGGLYAGIYQHRGNGPMPIKALTQMDVRVMSKDDYEEVPVLMNSTGESFNRFGFQGMPLFNFMLPKAGTYTLSGVYTGDNKGPKITVLLFPQSAQNVKQTLIVGVFFFIFFLALGIFVLIRLDTWAPPSKPDSPKKK